MSTQDPIQGLIDYVLAVKPFHTKILEVAVTYAHNDNVDIKVDESFEMDIDLFFPAVADENDVPIRQCDWGIEWDRPSPFIVVGPFVPVILNDNTTNLVLNTEPVVYIGPAVVSGDISGATISWSQLTGSPVTILNANTLAPSYLNIGSPVESRVFRLTITTSDGFVLTKDYTVLMAESGIQAFTSSGTFIVPNYVTSVDVLVVGGGGGGGSSGGSGGGGGGGVVYYPNYPVTPGTAIPVVVGAGGSGSSSTVSDHDGKSSSFDDVIVALGGGGGAQPANWYTGRDGSSGGGGAGYFSSGNYPGGQGTPGQGYDGGNGGPSGANGCGGGGGGAGGPGGNGTITGGGDGGIGVDYSHIFGTTYGDDGWFGGGGAGSAGARAGAVGGTGGKGGGADGRDYNESTIHAPIPNSGGGAAGYTAGNINGTGADGIVLVKYLAVI